MKVISIDIGIKHMAHCLFNVSNSISIDDWDVIDLTDEYKCACSKQATHQLNQTYYCKLHSCYTSKNLIELISLCTKNTLSLGTSTEMIKSLKRETRPIAPLSLVEIGKQIIKRYAKFNADVVLIENQIGPLASKMKSIQGLMVQYWLMRGAKVECISAGNKLKLFHSEKTTYTERKKLSIHYTTKMLELNNFNTTFLSHKKKDDLADTFLQGIWYFHNNNCGLLKINCS